MVVNVHKAKTNLSALIAQVEEGEEVIIARNGKPAVKLVLAETKVKRGEFPLGTMRAKYGPLPPDFEERWKEHKAEIARLFEESKLLPDEE